MAITEAIIPLTAFDTTMGLRMKLGLAPTNFMVCIKNRREYTVSRTVLLISATDIISNTAATAMSTKATFFILLLMVSTTSLCICTESMAGICFNWYSILFRLSVLAYSDFTFTSNSALNGFTPSTSIRSSPVSRSHSFRASSREMYFTLLI